MKVNLKSCVRTEREQNMAEKDQNKKVAKERKCRICLQLIEELDDDNIRIYDRYFCNCKGSSRYICELCALQYIKDYPAKCNECHADWRNIAWSEDPVPFTRCYEWFDGRTLEWITAFTVVFSEVAIVYFFGNPLYERVLSPIVEGHFSLLRWLALFGILYLIQEYYFLGSIRTVITYVIAMIIYLIYRLFGAPFYRDRRLDLL